VRHRNRTRRGNSSFPFHFVFRIRHCVFSSRAHISSWSRTRDPTSIRGLNHGWNRTIVILSDGQLRFLTHILTVETFEPPWGFKVLNEGLWETQHGLEIKLWVSIWAKNCASNMISGPTWSPKLWSRSESGLNPQLAVFFIKCCLAWNHSALIETFSDTCCSLCHPAMHVLCQNWWFWWIGRILLVVWNPFGFRLFYRAHLLKRNPLNVFHVSKDPKYHIFSTTMTVNSINRPNIHRLILPVLFPSPSSRSKLKSSNKLLVLEYSSRPFYR